MRVTATTKIGTAEEMAARLAAAYDGAYDDDAKTFRNLRHVLRKMTLDLVCASFPENHPPPDAIVELLRRALDLPKDHEIGGWPLTAGTRDDRGGVDHEMWATAMQFDHEYRIEHDECMPLRELARRVKERLGREPDRKSLRRWREQPDYWAEYSDELPAGYLPKK